MCATACFDIGYKVSDVRDDEGRYSSGEMSALSTSGVYVYNGCLAWYDVLLNPCITQA